MHADIYPSTQHTHNNTFVVSISSRKYLHSLSFGVFSFRPYCASHCLWFIHYSIFFKFFTAYVLFSRCSLVKKRAHTQLPQCSTHRVPQIRSLYLYLVFEQQPQVLNSSFSSYNSYCLSSSNLFLLHLLASLSLGFGRRKGGYGRLTAFIMNLSPWQEEKRKLINLLCHM